MTSSTMTSWKCRMLMLKNKMAKNLNASKCITYMADCCVAGCWEPHTTLTSTAPSAWSLNPVPEGHVSSPRNVGVSTTSRLKQILDFLEEPQTTCAHHPGIARSCHGQNFCASERRRFILSVLQLHPSKVFKTPCIVQLFWVAEFWFLGLLSF